ncbi:LAMI_0H05094g1_1 [Lachancea mirantina]|uniref:LAMI_0H05094g1_1 n=1 Tax=Lachancea mirantina TaxID=1230905 RepID=A0A1G4KEZ9_9SACH|nr:LAMI_0H05094g1_1 [Lachancea mirantina]
MSLFVRDESDDEELNVELSRHDDDSDGGQRDDLDQELYPLILDDNDNHIKPNVEEIRAVDIQLSLPLPFQQIVVENMLSSDDCLLILGTGLGTEPIVGNLLHVLATPTRIDGQDKRSLVLLLNSSEEDNEKIMEELLELSWFTTCDENQRPFNVVNSDGLSVEKRRQTYLEGGIISVTSRILIVDLLSGILHPNKITGLMIMHVDTLHNYSNESFIVEMYRSVNKWGFIKAVSDSPESFVSEFSPLARKLKDLRLKKVLLWPRFHVDISASLNFNKDNKVTEVKISLTDAMSHIQFGLFECLKKCIDELNRKNPTLALESWNIDNCLHPNFLKSIHAVLTPNWHRISFESKQLVRDINTLRKLLHALTSYDAVDFYEMIQIILDANKPSVGRKYLESPWLMAEESQIVISYAKSRVYREEKYELEELPKWEQLIAILKDISQDIMESTVAKGPVLIMCSDERTCRQVKKIASYSGQPMGLRRFMMRKLKAYMARVEAIKKTAKDIQEVNEANTVNGEIQVSRAFAKEDVISKRRRTRGAAAVAAVNRLKNSSAAGGEDLDALITIDDIEKQMSSVMGTDDFFHSSADNEIDEFDDILGGNDELKEEEDDLSGSHELSNEDLEAVDATLQYFEYINREDLIFVEKFHNKTNDLLLQEIMPSYLIMYEPDLSFIRKVEIYKAVYKDLSPKVYFMYYGDSVEEQRHLTAIRKEKEAFTKLIREHSQLAQHYETNEDLSRYRNLAQRKLQLSRSLRSSRAAGGQKAFDTVERDVVVVDIREFRAPLPGLLFRYGVKVVPCMLTVGDYVLTPQICVERKSIPDLISSFKSGRLSEQCKRMAKYYDFPTLLIEFSDYESFSLEPFSERRYGAATSNTHPISGKLMQDEIQMQLAKLVMAHPSLRIVWSSSPLQTVNILLEIKTDRAQPDPSACVQIGLKSKQVSSIGPQGDKANKVKLKELLLVPGLSNIDYYNLVRRCKSYRNLQEMTLDQIRDIIDDFDLTERIWNYVRREEEDGDDFATSS